MLKPAEAIVAGHICLDVIPEFLDGSGREAYAFKPGNLIHVGPSLQVTGGAVANTGLALHKLGIATRLIGKIGTDLYGQQILSILGQHDSALAECMVIDKGAATSYTIVISPPGVDRIFLHCPGANDSFGAQDVSWQHLEGARLLHFGYPPLMRRIHQDDGDQLLRIFHQARQMGLTTSLDMAAVDPLSEAGHVDWPAWLRHVLPCVDVFMPSLDELLFMLAPRRLDDAGSEGRSRRVNEPVDCLELYDLSTRLLQMGAAIVAIKLGQQGLYLRTAFEAARWKSLGAATPQDVRVWQGRELWSPCYQADFRGGTGAGDCTIAGFLARLLSGDSPLDALNAAVAVGACSVETSDATGGVPHWSTVRERIAAGWPKRAPRLACPDEWQLHVDAGIWSGPSDRMPSAP